MQQRLNTNFPHWVPYKDSSNFVV